MAKPSLAKPQASPIEGTKHKKAAIARGLFVFRAEG
jgi:hypothetical protein